MSLYGASVALAKIAILLLYVRVFTAELRKFTVGTIVIGCVISATGITTIVGSIFQCTPVAYNWDKTMQGRCINEIVFARYTAIPNVITGLAMLILPLPMVWRLYIEVPQKIALTASFLHGTIGFVASVTRLAILSYSSETTNQNPTLTAISWTIWTIVEPANYIIAACLPTLRPILVRIIPPSFFLLTNKRKSKPYSIVKISWPKGRGAPKISMATADIHGASHITGPWDRSRAETEDLEASGGIPHEEKVEDWPVTKVAKKYSLTPPLVS
ncbi:MAG: hypothetical protein Q9209_004084 [Squamulea sp. 1 TL-2023]